MGRAAAKDVPVGGRGNETSTTFFASEPIAISAVQTYSRRLSERTIVIFPAACSDLVEVMPSACNWASRELRISRTDFSSSEDRLLRSSANAPGPEADGIRCASVRAVSPKEDA